MNLGAGALRVDAIALRGTGPGLAPAGVNVAANLARLWMARALPGVVALHLLLPLAFARPPPGSHPTSVVFGDAHEGIRRPSLPLALARVVPISR